MKLTKRNEIALAAAMNEWFDNNQINFNSNKNFWSRNVVAKTLKDRMKLIKRYKNGPRGRGNPENFKGKRKLDF